MSSSNSQLMTAADVINVLKLSPLQVDRIVQTFDTDLFYGLSDTDDRLLTPLPMVKTFVTEVSSNCKTGQYLALDLGGTNFRIALGNLEKNLKDETFDYDNEAVPEELLSSPVHCLYDYMAGKLAMFLEDRDLKHLPFKLGYTFSFPVEMLSLKSAILLAWTKGFKCPGGVGQDHGLLLQEAINRRGDMQVEVVAVVNDTTATLLTGAFADRHCSIGVILGTGSNAAYYEHIHRISQFASHHYTRDAMPKRMAIDIEWGCFGDNGSLKFIKSEFDHLVDSNSSHVGSYMFEKMFSGLYFGELCRVVLVRLAEKGLFIKGAVEKLPKPFCLPTSCVAPADADPLDGPFPNTHEAMRKMDLLSICSLDDIRILRYLVAVVSERSADIISAVLCSIVKKVAHKGSAVTIAFDGSLYKHHPRLSSLMQERLDLMCAPFSTKVHAMIVENGSVRGAAYAASLAEHYRPSKQRHAFERLLLPNGRSDRHLAVDIDGYMSSSAASSVDDLTSIGRDSQPQTPRTTSANSSGLSLSSPLSQNGTPPFSSTSSESPTLDSKHLHPPMIVNCDVDDD